MKKIKLSLLLLIVAFVTILAVGTVANAEELETSIPESEITASDGEIAIESDFITESGEIPDESEITVESGNKPLTPDEIKDGIDEVLTDNQKQLVEKLTAILSKYINIAPTVLYCVIGAVLIVCVFVFVLIAKNSNKKLKIKELTEQNKAVIAMAKTSDDKSKELSEVLKKLSSDGFEKMLEERNAELEKTLLSSLKLDSNTVGELLSKTTLSIAYMERIVEAFKIMASKSGNVALLNELSTAPTSAEFKRLEVENLKLKTALGDDAVNKILSE